MHCNFPKFSYTVMICCIPLKCSLEDRTANSADLDFTASIGVHCLLRSVIPKLSEGTKIMLFCLKAGGGWRLYYECTFRLYTN